MLFASSGSLLLKFFALKMQKVLKIFGGGEKIHYLCSWFDCPMV